MHLLELSGSSKSFFERGRAFLFVGLLLTATVVAALAQTNTGSPQSVRLKVVAADSAGNPVSDLASADFTVFDDGAPQTIVSMRLHQSDTPHPLVILFDLMNAGESSRGAVWSAIKTSLAHVRTTGPLYLYLLAEDGGLYPVHALPVPPAAPDAADASWLKDVGPLMNAAMQKVSQVRPADFRTTSQISLTSRFKATYSALNDLRTLMAQSRGPQDLLWITYGIPSTIQFVDHTWFYGAPVLRQLGAAFVQSGITVYTADPGINLQAGILNRDSLDILSGATGGRAFATIAMGHAIAQIDADARTSYSLEFQPPSANWDGKYHKLRVTVARKGVHALTELGYFAVSGS
jgi:VWFA-related protein